MELVERWVQKFHVVKQVHELSFCNIGQDHSLTFNQYLIV